MEYLTHYWAQMMGVSVHIPRRQLSFYINENKIDRETPVLGRMIWWAAGFINQVPSSCPYKNKNCVFWSIHAVMRNSETLHNLSLVQPRTSGNSIWSCGTTSSEKSTIETNTNMAKKRCGTVGDAMAAIKHTLCKHLYTCQSVITIKLRMNYISINDLST